MYAQKKFTLKNSPYAAAVESWANVMVENEGGHDCSKFWVSPFLF
jgi:hypothetical protein